MEELIKEIEKHLTDEDKDMQNYKELANKFMEHGHDGIAQILMDISAEEAVHARHLREVIASIAE